MQNAECEMHNPKEIKKFLEWYVGKYGENGSIYSEACTNALALIESQDQRIEELTVELEGLRGIMKSYIKEFGGESASRVPIGSKLYFILDEDFSDVPEERVCECTVTAIGKKGFWTSAFVSPRDDAGEFTSFEDIGKVAFFTREEALRQLMGGEKRNDV